MTAILTKGPYKRNKDVRRSVILADKVARFSITIGGVSVIAAVLGIMLFLLGETVPLFFSGTVESAAKFPLDWGLSENNFVAIDDNKAVAVAVDASGKYFLVHPKTGSLIAKGEFKFEESLGAVSSFAADEVNLNLLYGFESGKVLQVAINFQLDILDESEVPVGLTKLDERDSMGNNAVFTKIPGGQIRRLTAGFDRLEPTQVSPENTPIMFLDFKTEGNEEKRVSTFFAADIHGSLYYHQETLQANLLTDEVVKSSNTVSLGVSNVVGVKSLLVTDDGNTGYVLDEKDVIHRFNLYDENNPLLAESHDVHLDDNEKISSINSLLGGGTLLVGTTLGRVFGYYSISNQKDPGLDGHKLVRTKVFLADKGPGVSRFVTSKRDKSFLVQRGKNQLFLLHGTSQKELLSSSEFDIPGTIMQATLSPRLDGLMVSNLEGQGYFWEFDIDHPETTFSTLFLPIWYEGYEKPTLTWQSSAATDDFEPKLSMIPLIFGTMKATLYSLLFAVPIAILAAIFTSEFLSPKIRGVVKPVIEIMASLPSVVLGFVAALVLAPFVESWITAIIGAFFSVPLALMLAAYLWQCLPSNLAIRLSGSVKFGLMVLLVCVGIFSSIFIGLGLENLLFNGDLKSWLSGKTGQGGPFIFLMLVPVSFLLTQWFLSRFFGRVFEKLVRSLDRFKAAGVDFIRWTLTCALSFGLAWLGAYFLGVAGFDARDGVVSTYMQRNTLVVGMAMGFAVIPIIYTLAEDAIRAVPEHLRAGALGCGSTPWQSALYIVLPSAISGIFSAVMIGMGRAVGETMIVVMSAGNTPIMDWNIFNGLRALSATIAVELPEAVKGGTLYRVLFFAGLLLFAITFVINTVAEVVRQKFRKRAAQL